MKYRLTEIELYPKAGGTVELDEDAMVLDAEYRTANRVVAAVLLPANDLPDLDPKYCQYIKSDGEQCGIETDDEYCHLHP